MRACRASASTTEQEAAASNAAAQASASTTTKEAGASHGEDLQGLPAERELALACEQDTKSTCCLTHTHTHTHTHMCV
jgi:hypothetical protein